MNQTSNPYAPCPCGSNRITKMCCGGAAGAPAASPQAELESFQNAAQGLEEAIYHGDRTLKLLNAGKPEQAEAPARNALALAPFMPHFHNNLALVLIHLGRLEEAEAVQRGLFEEVDPNNTFGKAQLAYIYYLRGDEEEAGRQLDRLTKARCESVDALSRVCISMTLLRRHAELVKLVRRNRKQLSPFSRVQYAVALANLGNEAEARKALGGKFREGQVGQNAWRAVTRLRKRKPAGTIDGRWWALQMNDFVPHALLRKAAENGQQPEVSSGALADSFIHLINQDPDQALPYVRLLGDNDHPRAVQALIDIAGGRFGGDDLRRECHSLLHQMGVWKAGEKHDLFLNGEVRPIANIEVTDDAPVVEVPEEHIDLYIRSVEAARDGDQEEALALAHELFLLLPANPIAMGNYAAQLISAGPSRFGEAERMLHHLCELHPSYAHAPANLSIHYCFEGRLEEAQEVLDRFVMPPQIAPEAMAWLQVAHAYILHANGDLDGAKHHLSAAETVDPEHPQLASVRRFLFPFEFPQAKR